MATIELTYVSFKENAPVYVKYVVLASKVMTIDEVKSSKLVIVKV